MERVVQHGFYVPRTRTCVVSTGMRRESLWNGLDIDSCGCRLLLVSYKLFLVIAYAAKVPTSLCCSAHLMCLYGARMLYKTLLVCQPDALKEKMR